MQKPLIYLFTKDLRIHDNPALVAAVNSGKPLITLYIHAQDTANPWVPGAASQWWLHHSLTQLSKTLDQLGGRLILRKGDVLEQLESIITCSQADALYFSRQYEAHDRRLETRIMEQFSQQLDIQLFKGYLLHEPEDIRTANKQAYKVYTPFYKKCRHEMLIAKVVKAPRKLTVYSRKKITSDKLSSWKLLPTRPNWAKQFATTASPGEAGALQQLDDFVLHACVDYTAQRNRPDLTGTSHLSAHLHFGEISPRQVWSTVTNQQQSIADSGESFLRQLMWREFCYHLLIHWPDLPEQPFKSAFKQFPWKKNKKLLLAWQQGNTGFPIVDAGMRELWQSGWMHNRVRMISASFLVKDCLISWQQGQAWFWHTLIDADLANNAAGWQWVAGCGGDAAPYFRVFNPVLQGKKFDPDGNYIRRWIPELSALPKKYIHAPWQAPKEVLAEANITLGKQYPHPVVDHDAARTRALACYKTLKDKR